MSHAQKRGAEDEAEWIDVDDFTPPKPNPAPPRPVDQDEDDIIETEDTYRGTDFLCTAGAHELKRRIEKYWRDKGYEVRITLEEGPFHAAVRSSRQDVRSDMVNGLPRRKTA